MYNDISYTQVMDNYLEEELRRLAQEILDTHTEDLTVWHEKSRLLYERLTVLLYTASAPSAPSEEEKPTAGTIESVVSHHEDTAVEIVSETTEEPTEKETKEENAISAAEETHEEYAEEPAEDAEEVTDTESATPQESAASTAEEAEEKESPVAEDKKKTKRHASKTEDIFQQSLFDQDLFSNEIIGFDPDEDIFEKAPSSVAKEPELTADEPPTVEETEYPVTDFIPEESIEEVSPQADTETAVFEVSTPKEETEEDKETEPAAAEKKSFFSFRILDEEDEDNESEDEKHEDENLDDDVVPPAEEKAPDADMAEYTDAPSKEEEPSDSMQEEDISVSQETSVIEENDMGAEEDAVPVEGVEKAEEKTAEMTINEALAQNTDAHKQSVNEMLAAKNMSISLNDRIAFINNLFDGEVEDFENTIRYIFSQKEPDVVIEYITEIIKPYYNNWIEKEDYEKRFMAIILKYFS